MSNKSLDPAWHRPVPPGIAYCSETEEIYFCLTLHGSHWPCGKGFFLSKMLMNIQAELYGNWMNKIEPFVHLDFASYDLILHVDFKSRFYILI